MMLNTEHFKKYISKFDNWTNYILPVIFAVLTFILAIQFAYILFFDTNLDNKNIIANNNNNNNNNSYNQNDFLFKHQLPLQLCPQVTNTEITESNLKCEINVENKSKTENETENNNQNQNIAIKTDSKKIFVPTITKHQQTANLPSFVEENKPLSTAENHFINAEKFVNNNDWKNAQQEFFNAYNKQQNNPVYAYNLAISLEQLNQANFAIDYYKKTLEIIETNPKQNTAASIFNEEKIQQIKQRILFLQTENKNIE